MDFQIKRRLLSEEEKYRRAIFFYTYDMPDFEVTYPDDEIVMDEYGQPLININDNFNRLDDRTKALVLEFVSREIYDETIDLKCLNCNYEELNEDWDTIQEEWDGYNYPKMYCPNCGKPQFVPMDIWKQKNKYKK